MAAYEIKSVEVWAGDILNKPGMLARVLEGLSGAGAELEFLVARQLNEHTSRVFLAPLKGKKQKAAAADVGVVPATGMHCLRIEGPDRDGLGAEITRGIAALGVNLRGMSAASLGRKSAIYLAFSSEADASVAMKALRKAFKGGKKKS